MLPGHGPLAPPTQPQTLTPVLRCCPGRSPLTPTNPARGPHPAPPTLQLWLDVAARGAGHSGATASSPRKQPARDLRSGIKSVFLCSQPHSGPSGVGLTRTGPRQASERDFKVLRLFCLFSRLAGLTPTESRTTNLPAEVAWSGIAASRPSPVVGGRGLRGFRLWWAWHACVTACHTQGRPGACRGRWAPPESGKREARVGLSASRRRWRAGGTGRAAALEHGSAISQKN